MRNYRDAEALQSAGALAVDKLTDWETRVVQVEYETYEDEDNLPGKLVKQVRHLLDVIDDAGPPVANGALERLADLNRDWSALKAELKSINSTEIAAVNAWASGNAVPHVADPSAD